MTLPQISNIKSQNYKANPQNDLKYRAAQFSLAIIKTCVNLSKDDAAKIIKNQLIRCATSIGANIVEAKSSSSRKDFIKFYEIALKSANETKYWLYLLQEGKFLSSTIIQPLQTEVDELSKILAASIITLKGKRYQVLR